MPCLRNRPVSEALALAEGSVSRFPLDTHLRDKRRYVRAKIATIPSRQVSDNATRFGGGN